MAYINGSLDEEDDRKKQTSLANGSPGLLSGTQANGNGAVDGKPTGSGFVNLQKYLGVNQDKANGMAADIASQGSNELGNVGSSTGNFNSMNAGQGVSRQDQAGLNSLESTLNGVTYADQVSKETQDFLSNPNVPKSYSGNSSAQVDSALDNVNSSINKASDKAKLFADGLDGSNQRANYLKEKYNKNGNYTSGEGGFDSFLTGASDKAQSGIFSDRSKQFSGAIDNAKKNISGDRVDGLKSNITNNQSDIGSYNEKFGRLKALMNSKLGNLRPEPVAPIAAPIAPPPEERQKGVASTAGIPNAQGLPGLATNVVDTVTKAGADIAKEPGKAVTKVLHSTGDGMHRGSDAINRATQPVGKVLTNAAGQIVDALGNVIEDTGEKLNPFKWKM